MGSASHPVVIVVQQEVERLLAEIPRAMEEPDAPVLVACSGGRDSVALAALLSEAAMRPVILAHINHQLQPSGDRDHEREVVQEVGRRLGRSVVHRTAEGIDAERNVEEQARRARYRLLAEIAAETGAVAIATAHHQDDQVETVLLRIFTGRSPLERVRIAERRVLGPPGSSGVPVIRPLLRQPSAVLERVCSDWQLPFHQDKSNQDQRFLRNRIRSVLVPALQEVFSGYNPGAALLQGTEELDAARSALEQSIPPEVVAKRTTRGCRLDRARFNNLPKTVQVLVLRQELYRITRDTRLSVAPIHRFVVADSSSRLQHFGEMWIQVTKEAIVIRDGVVPGSLRGYLLVVDKARIVTVIKDPLTGDIAGVSVVAPQGSVVHEVVSVPVELPVVLRSPRRGDTLRLRGRDRPLRTVATNDCGLVIENSNGVLCLVAGTTALYCRDGVDLRTSASTGNRDTLTLNFVCEEQD